MVFDLDQFDALLLKSIDDVFTEVVGELNAKIIFDYLEKKSCPISEIYQRLDTFSEEIRMLLGSGRGQMLGSARVLERTVLEVLCSRIGIAFDPERIDFPGYVRELKEAYEQKRQTSQFKIEMEVKNP
jgi:hypothetical protein